MGANVEEAEKVEEPKLSNGAEKIEEPKLANGTNASINEKKTESVGGCCQGVNGFSCCRDDNAEKQPGKEEVVPSSWMGKWDQRQVLTTVAVVGAVATIAVAYGVYRRAR